MPTFNQLVRKGRQQVTYKSTSPALQHGLNTLKNKETDLASPRSVAFAPQFVLRPRRSRTPLFVRSPVSASPMAMRSPLTSPASVIPCRSTLWS